MNLQEFKELMQTVAKGWNTKNAAMAVDCFTQDAIYIEPPDKQFFKGKDELYQYFVGDTGIDMRLIWRNLFFDEANQTGVGEYTFEMNGISHHGVSIVELQDRKIRLWREYDIVTNLSYEEFLKTEGKKFMFTIKDLAR